jgi:5'-nucleotidase (lipoprotein e(P4) family)
MAASVRVLAVLLLATDAGCATHPPPPAARSTVVRSTHEGLNGVLWVQTSVEYQAVARQAYRQARMQLDFGLNDRRWTAATEQTSDPSALPPAVVLDLDETVLDNSAFQARLVVDQSTYSEETWVRWCEERKAGAVPGAVEFLKYAKDRGVKVFFITNRDHQVEAATRDNLTRLGIPHDTSEDTVLTRRERPEWSASDKTPRRRAVAERYRVVLLVGDDLGDFIINRGTVDERQERAAPYADYWGTKWITLPNPMYGSWEQAVTAGLGSLDDAAILAAKYRALGPKPAGR